MSGPTIISPRRPAMKLVEIADTMAIPPADMALAKRIHDTLQQHYPGHPWAVHVDHSQGWAHFRLTIPEATGAARTWAYVLKIADLKADPLLRCVVTGGGEFLERWGLPRRGHRPGDVYRAIGNGLDKQLNHSRFDRYRPDPHLTRGYRDAVLKVAGFEGPLIGARR